MGRWLAKKGADLWTSLFLVVFSGAVIVEALDLEVGTPNSPGSGFMIFGAAVVLGGLGVLQVLHALLTRRQEGETTASQDLSRWRVAAVIGANVLYIVLLEPVGYLLCTFFLLTFLLQVYRKGSWGWAVGGAAGAALVTYVFFSKLLQLSLPKGLLPFF